MIQHPVIQLENICYQYPDGTPALSHVSLAINRGEKVVLLGGNGAGKSTLFLLLNGILKPQQGTYYFEKEKVDWRKTTLKHLRTKIGILFQEPDNQLFAANVYEELSFGLLNLGLPEPAIRERIENTLSTVDLVRFDNRAPHLLSHGQKKRVAIAAIMAMNPDVFVFDEPLSGLDPAHSTQILGLFNQLNQQGKTLIVSTHDVNFGWSWADKVIAMQNGRLVKMGTPLEIFTDEELIRACQLEVPYLLRIYNHLHNNSLPLPHTMDDLLQKTLTQV